MPMPENMDNFIAQLGLPFLAHMLRRMSDILVAGAGKWESEIGIRAQPRTASTLQLLARNGRQSVTDIAARLRQSHPLVITWIRHLETGGFVRTSPDPSDGRRTFVSLTAEGRREAERMRRASDVIGCVYRELLNEVGVELFDALVALEAACERRSVLERLRAEARRGRIEDRDA